MSFVPYVVEQSSHGERCLLYTSPPYELMEAIGRKRGLLVRGGEVNTCLLYTSRCV